jgi:hypothetical protein
VIIHIITFDVPLKYVAPITLLGLFVNQIILDATRFESGYNDHPAWLHGVAGGGLLAVLLISLLIFAVYPGFWDVMGVDEQQGAQVAYYAVCPPHVPLAFIAWLLFLSCCAHAKLTIIACSMNANHSVAAQSIIRSGMQMMRLVVQGEEKDASGMQGNDSTRPIFELAAMDSWGRNVSHAATALTMRNRRAVSARPERTSTSWDGESA